MYLFKHHNSTLKLNKRIKHAKRIKKGAIYDKMPRHY
jgi:hypothetical protein